MQLYYHSRPSHRKLFFTILPSAVISAIFYLFYFSSTTSRYVPFLPGINEQESFITKKLAFKPTLKYFLDFPLKGPNFRDQFADLGRRTQILRQWIELNEIHNDQDFLENYIEKLAASMYPFILDPNKMKYDVNYTTPLTDLRNSYIPGSKGIVIPVATKGYRYAVHLAAQVREVFNCQLPIQIMYAGEKELPYILREKFMSVIDNVEFVDLTYVLNDKPMNLKDGGSAIRPFSVLASKFEQTILIGEDVVFVQSPETLFEQKSYLESGALLFHDRLLWKDWFKERHEWWHKQMESKVPSKTLNSSLVWTQNYSEEGSSAVVVIDKSRLSKLMGLLHICWQNTEQVRKEATYKLGNGDKESWWFGFELTNSTFSFEKHYGAVAGHIKKKKEGDAKDVDKVCAFAIAHVDQDEKLIWYNGGLLKNLARNQTDFDIPTQWMVDGEWEKGGPEDLSCMKGKPIRNVTASEISLLKTTIEVAQRYDREENLLEATKL